MWIFLIFFIIILFFIILIPICCLVLVYTLNKKGKIITAKNYFDKLILTNQSTPEKTKEECEQKMIILQSCKITFATGWLVFWWFFGFGIGFIICIVLGFSNKTTRIDYKNQELIRLQMKINNLVNIEINKKKV